MSVNPQHPLTSADGTDVTEAVQVIYDLAHSSMDWGSGMLGTDEMEAVVAFAVHMGWGVPSFNDTSADEHSLAVARKYPEHYRITRYEMPGEQYWPRSTAPRVFWAIQTKVNGEWTGYLPRNAQV